MTFSRTVTIVNKLGLHARAATQLVKCASGFESHITISREERKINGKSIMGVLMLAAAQGCEIGLQADGADAEAALAAIERLIAERFGEDE
jgi:phosphocarrier protein